ncbi:unnamed protein product [Linum tenue]|uniref:Uncharacterized protein n=2 Tax=Linum tenue TaxID=586396 RepID=A0AAV0JIT1_9ROSI|nr:unnamed protein product [Linum tenue]
MAGLNHLTIIITLAAAILISLSSHPHTATATAADVDDDVEYYVLDNPTTTRFRSRSLFLNERIRKGMRCSPGGGNICDGVPANNGTSLLYCCKNNCRNVRQDENNCGACGNKCGFGRSCCNGACISLAYDADNCGECNQRCSPGQKCEYGSCGYA